MPHKKLQDVIPHRSGRATKQSSARTKEGAPNEASAKKGPEPKAPSMPPQPPRSGGRDEGKRRGRFMVWGGIIAVVGLSAIGFALLFSKSVVTIHAKEAVAHVDSTLLAYRGDETRSDTVPFELMTLKDSVSREVEATKIEEVEQQASGTIIIYNDYNANSQRLIKNTRFRTPDGKIYRIRESIDVPGQRTVDGETVPGSVEAKVYADKPGADYNAPKQDFTIPGFEGTPRFDAFYARSKTPLTGGYSGVVKTIEEEEYERIRGELRETLRERLMSRAREQTPETFALFDDGTFFSFSEDDGAPRQENDQAETVNVSVSAELAGVIFPKDALSAYLAEQLLPANVETEKARIANMSELSFAFIDKEHFSPSDNTQFSFTLSGETHFTWHYDGGTLKAALAGLAQDEVKDALDNFQGIERAEVSLRPFWRKSLPEDPQEITVVEE